MSILSEFLTMLGVQDDFCIQLFQQNVGDFDIAVIVLRSKKKPYSGALALRPLVLRLALFRG
ncbi:MAG: hypothetical protein BECKG1743D_GA0114223_105391 [Candidatus Kentron sp. G]|nr:MAG: hypothetical protein BECKG1743F_GA0114225_103691 [Candidatus Kentron sp. G]VFN02570.1 MAG: hypothetical protein BECKG1743E_GA0114224_105201 [Candidatus Kentron sp. G]VFN04026.1 MAG: hypothetical protein BECKG1743D_GA0114223_105391 [Candidatus Kentron sp. G]